MAVDAEPLIEPQQQQMHQQAAAGNAYRLGLKRVSGETWDAAAADFDGIAQEQLYAFARNRWPGVACEPALFMDETRAVGGVLVMIQPLPLKLGQLAVAKWGPVLADNQADDRDETYAAMIDAMIGEYADKRGMMLSVLPKATPSPANFGFEHLKKRGFASGSGLLFPDRYIVNLRQDDDALRASYAQKWRYHLKKSEKAGLSFERAGPERLEIFDQLYEAMTERKRFADHSAYDTVQDLMAVPNDSLRPELFFVREGGEIIAGAIVFKAGDTAVYLYGATVDRALPLRAGYFMHDLIIKWLRDNTSAKWYDLGGTDGFQGLHQFKKGMVGTAGHIEPVPPVMNYASHLRAKMVGSLAYALRDGAQHLRRRIEMWRGDLATPDQDR